MQAWALPVMQFRQHEGSFSSDWVETIVIKARRAAVRKGAWSRSIVLDFTDDLARV